MQIRAEATPLSKVAAKAALVFVSKGKDPSAQVREAGTGFVGAFHTLWARETFTGAAGQVAVLHERTGARIETLVLVGTGDRGAGLDVPRNGAADGAKAARDAGADRLAVLLPDAPAAHTAAETVVEGVRLGLYVFEGYKSDKSKKAVAEAVVLAPASKLAAARRGVEEGTILADSVVLVRDLGNEPGNVCTPTYLAEQATAIGRAHGLDVRVLERADMQALGMGALLGVAQGSAQPPKLIVMTWEPKGASRRTPTVAVVGKGLTFDSGGISIKPADKMEDMKFDMCGGGAVLGVMQAVARLALPVRVVGLVPASENLPDGLAYKPGDILKASNGTTIEIVNTDAEGRLILSDALAYATSKLRPKPEAVIDMATLTGACVVALGSAAAGLMSNDDRLAARLEAAAETSGDPVWRMPLKDRYREQIKSVYADLKNSGGRDAGALTAACFLERFVGGTPWAHLDIAGTAWGDGTKGVSSRGASGFGVRLVVRALQAWGSK
ncbi:MAG: leucyl aminopeptidase [Planctomycetes bacterium]|nr:leucyl aminopeptidase [Planctomycetota bacterium]